MNCAEAEALLNVRLDGEEGNLDCGDLDSHLETCQVCTQRLQRLHILDRQLKDKALAWRQDGLDTGFLMNQLPRPRRRTPIFWPLAAAVLLVAFMFWWKWPQEGWHYELIAEGSSQGGVLVRGAWLTVPEGTSARLGIADIGEMQLDAGARVKLIRSDDDEHRLHLAAGRIQASVMAPPRLFLVETPATLAVDLGCAYEMSVEDDGSTLLKVSSGRVAFAGIQGEVIIPAGATCRCAPDGTPGVPFFPDAPEDFQMLLRGVGFQRGPYSEQELAVLTGTGHLQDSLSLLYLLPRVDIITRRRLVDHLLTLLPPEHLPLRRALEIADPTTLEESLDALEWRWMLGLEGKGKMNY